MIIDRVGIALAAYQPNIDHFREQLISIQNQAFRDWICVVRFDSPMGPILEDSRLSPLLADPRFRWHENSVRLGHLRNFERALQDVLKERVDAVAFSDQDDVWYPHKLETLVKELRRRGRHSLVHSDMHLLTKAVGVTQAQEATVWKLENRNVSHVKPHHLIARNVVTGAASLFDARLAERFQDIPLAFAYHDHWYALVVACHGRVYPIHEPLHAYRQHATNVLGAKPFKGLFRRRKPGARSSLVKARASWSKARAIARAAEREGLHLPLLARMLYLSRFDAGLGLIGQGLFRIFTDRPLARQSFLQGAGKLLTLLKSPRDPS